MPPTSRPKAKLPRSKPCDLPWWKVMPIQNLVQDPHNYAVKAITALSIATQSQHYRHWNSGDFKDGIDAFIAKAQDLGASLLATPFSPDRKVSRYLSWPEGILSLEMSGSHYWVGYETTNYDLAKQLHALIEESVEPAKSNGNVFMICRTPRGSLEFRSVGLAGLPLQADNYAPNIMDDYAYVVKQLKRESPHGRILIMDGHPGTGKTYLIRSIMNDVPDAFFIFVPPAMITELTGPELFPVILDLQTMNQVTPNGETRKAPLPVVLVLEDADHSLIPRGSDNVQSISTLLNISEGIIGNLLNVSIIATTNAKLEQIDEALRRPGRLLRRMHFEGLPYEQANDIYQRLTSSTNSLPVKDQLYRLGEIYDLASPDGPVEDDQPLKQPVGFVVERRPSNVGITVSRSQRPFFSNPDE